MPPRMEGLMLELDRPKIAETAAVRSAAVHPFVTCPLCILGFAAVSLALDRYSKVVDATEVRGWRIVETGVVARIVELERNDGS